MPKSPLELTYTELSEVIRTGQWPDGCDLTCILTDVQLAPLARKPSILARKILNLGNVKKKEEKKIEPKIPKIPRERQPLKYIPDPTSLNLKEKALKLKEEKLQLDKDKQVRQLDLYNLIEKMNRNISILIKEVFSLKKEVSNLKKEAKE